MDRETYIQLDRIEAKINYLIEEFEEVYPKEETQEEQEEDETTKRMKEKGTLIEKKPKIKTSIKDTKSEIIDNEDE